MGETLFLLVCEQNTIPAPTMCFSNTRDSKRDMELLKCAVLCVQCFGYFLNLYNKINK